MAKLSIVGCLLLICTIIQLYTGVDGSSDVHDLPPYMQLHGSALNHRQVRECQPVHFGNLTYEQHPVHRSKPGSTKEDGAVLVQTFAITVSGIDERLVKGHSALVSDPLRTVSVLEPVSDGGCTQHQRGTVAASTRQHKCLVAMNAGFFNTTTGSCIGNVVSDGRMVQNSGMQNAQFGIEKNGTFFIGYISDEELTSNTDRFSQLISGVIWLVRNGKNYVNHSIKAECPDVQETGSFERFANVRSARTAVGHDKEGRMILLHVEGKTDVEGVNLWDLAEIMKRFGAVNAINTDGGGSATFLWNDVVINYPSDDCSEHNFLKCARNVSTVFCIHGPECDCGLHGECSNGRCICKQPWIGANCSTLPCHQDNCSGHGHCTENGCLCDHGWTNDTNMSCRIVDLTSSQYQTNNDVGECMCENLFSNVSNSCNTVCCAKRLGDEPTIRLPKEQYILWLVATMVSSCLAVIGLCTSAVLLCSKRKHRVKKSRWRLKDGGALDLSSSDEENFTMLLQPK